MHRLSFLFFATSFASFCGETFRAEKGLLTSKEVFGESYRNKIDCRWHIQTRLKKVRNLINPCGESDQLVVNLNLAKNG